MSRFGEAFGIDVPRAPMVDKRLHKERLASGGQPPVVTTPELGGLPDGTMIAHGDAAYALRAGQALEWSFAGYASPITFDRLADLPLRMLTPATTIAVLRRGFQPVWHPTADT